MEIFFRADLCIEVELSREILEGICALWLLLDEEEGPAADSVSSRAGRMDRTVSFCSGMS